MKVHITTPYKMLCLLTVQNRGCWRQGSVGTLRRRKNVTNSLGFCIQPLLTLVLPLCSSSKSLGDDTHGAFTLSGGQLLQTDVLWTNSVTLSRYSHLGKLLFPHGWNEDNNDLRFSSLSNIMHVAHSEKLKYMIFYYHYPCHMTAVYDEGWWTTSRAQVGRD